MALAFAVYAATLSTDLYSLDSPELAAVAYRLGIAHAPGYPLYTLVGWAFSHALPVGSVAFRLNLLSAVFATAGCGVAYLLALRLTSRPLVAAAGALALGFSYYFWFVSLAAEVYTLDALLFLSLLLVALHWRDGRSLPLAAVAGLIFGLACATRTTSVLFFPALVAFVALSGERRPAAWGAAAAGVLGGLSFYLYLPLRSLAGVDLGPGQYGADGTLRVWDMATLSGFWNHVTASDFQDDVFAYSASGIAGEAGTFVVRLAGAFLFVGLPLGVAGIVRQWRTDRALLFLVAGLALPQAVFFIGYGAVDKEFMFLPVYIAWALWVIIGLDWLVDAVSSGERAWLTPSAASVAVLALPLLLVAVNWSRVTLHEERGIRADAEAFFALVPQDAIVYGPFWDLAPLTYLQEVEGQRTDVRLVNNWTSDDRLLVAMAEANVGARPFFVTRHFIALQEDYVLRALPDKQGYEVLPGRER
ncbi:MAG TPA: DUF2723 domain-containing protein [Dehalococcoidia bacterium]|nr:DUF2723 domain-containing protein [Dehalococcoidia bacterium]